MTAPRSAGASAGLALAGRAPRATPRALLVNKQRIRELLVGGRTLPPPRLVT
jgi:hypothetical protein